MKITKITISNLASIAGEYTIDFEQEPLRSAGIFAISGPTGSGKSTILDAMCLALYDKMPRFEHSAGSTKISDNGKAEISQTDVRNILRRGATEGRAEVEFIGADELRYLSSWTIRRSYGKADGNLQAQSIRVYNLSTGEELQGTKTDILNQLVRLIGLTYTQFTRTVLLAQNDFATFLKSNENDKAELLEKLTGTDIYSKISMEIFKCFRAEEQTLNTIKLSLGDIKLIPEEEIEPRRIALTAVVEFIDKQRAMLEESKKKAEAFVDIKRIVDTESKQEKELNEVKLSLEKLDKEIVEQKLIIERFEEQTNAKENEIQQAAELDAVLSTKHESFQVIQAKLKRRDDDLALIQKALSKEKLNVDKVNLELQQIYHDYGFSSDKSVEDIIANIEIAANDVSKSLTELKQEKAKLNIESAYESQRKLSLEKEYLAKLKADYSLFLERSGLLAKHNKRLSDCQEALTEFTAQLNKLRVEQTTKNSAFEQVKELYHKAQLQVSENVERLRNQLKAGEECPVCGSTKHEFTNKAVEDLFKVFQDAYHKTETELLSVNKLIAGVEANVLQTNKESSTLIKEIEELDKIIKELTLTYKEEEFNADFMGTLAATQQKKEVDLNTIISSYNDLQKKSEALEIRQNKAHELQKILTRITGQITEANAAYRLVEQEYKASDISRAELSKELELAKKDLKEFEESRAKLLKGKSVSEVRAFIQTEKKNKNDVLLTMQERQLTLSQLQAGLQGSLSQLKEQLNKLYAFVDKFDLDSLTQTIQRISLELETKEKVKSELEYELKRNDENRTKSKQLTEKLNKQMIVFERWAKLNELIGSAKGDKFKVIAQSYTLKILLLHANQHLTYLARRYQLKQIDESLSLQIIDRDMLNQERTILSLSGGESFLISLALALGLSSLSSNNLKVESLFIDEGFGSLDIESLRTAMEALEQLQMQGRKIGVISHVQEMSERIPVQIRLIREEQGKSKIEVG